MRLIQISAEVPALLAETLSDFPWFVWNLVHAWQWCAASLLSAGYRELLEGVKRPETEAVYFHPRNSKVKNI